jgi:molecular chaperone GrpE
MADDRTPEPGDAVRGPGAAASDGGPAREERTALEERGPGGETVETLRAERDARAREAAEAQDRYLRALAEFDNYRKRIAREREEWTRRAREQLLRELLPALDNLDRALQAPPTPGTDQAFRAGVELIHREFLAALERAGVRPFAAVGDRFDPSRHEAVGRVERTDVEDETVVAETLRGYLIDDRVLRPAHVVVAVRPPALPPGGGGAA